MNKCKECNKEFVGRKKTQKFCSKSCASKHTVRNRKDNWRRDNRGTNNPMYGKTQTNVNSLKNLTPGNKGYKHTEEWKKELSDRMMGKVWTQEQIDKRKETMIANGHFWKPDDPEYKKFKRYKRKVYWWTYKNDLSKLNHYEDRGLKEYHLDHKYSICEGFKNGIPPKVIGNIKNLEYLHYKENISKGIKCSITLEELHGVQ